MSFIAGLSDEDLRRLRVVVKERIFPRLGYPMAFRTDYEADKLIEAYGGETAQKLLRAEIEKKSLEVLD